jgi:DNA-directed RNA polymerase subunit RPC12/RpoP
LQNVSTGYFCAVIFFFSAFFLIGVLYGSPFPFQCSRCGKNFDLNAIDQNISYCPYCGVDLNVLIDPKSYEPTEFLKKEWGQRGSEIKNTDIQLPSRNPKGNAGIQLSPGKEEKGTA